MSLNSLTADFKIRYDVDETGAQKLVTFSKANQDIISFRLFLTLEFTET